MFSVEGRARIRDLLLARAEADGAIAGAAFTGSVGAGDDDRWSDTDLVLAVRGDLGAVADRWTRWLYDELAARHHFALACLRLGYPAVHVKGAHLLPDELVSRLQPALVRSLDEPELRRALGAVAGVTAYELERSDPGLAVRLCPMLADLAEQ